MNTKQQDLAETHHNLSDEEIASLHTQISSLGNDARRALQSGLKGAESAPASSDI
jgi:hypothetical protein